MAIPIPPWNNQAIDPKTGRWTVTWYNYLKSADTRLAALEALQSQLSVVDGITAPAAVVGRAQAYVDIADGDYKIKFGDGVTKTLATDT